MTHPTAYRSPITKRFRRWKFQQAASAAVGAALHRAPPLGGINGRRIETLARRISQCAASATIKLETPPGEPTSIVFRNKRSCRNGLCPQCARRRARDTVRRGAEKLDALMAAAPGTRFAFLTLTSKNMPIAEVATMLSNHERALTRFWRRRQVAAAFTGHITGIEIAIRRNGDSWEAGVHSHSTVVLGEGYFDRRATTYLRQPAIVAHWRRALGVDYNPICHVKAIAVGDAVRATLTETLKYAVAPHRLFERGDTGFSVDPAVAAHLASALYKRRLCRMGGVLIKRRPKQGGTS
ncbi:MAG: protein rep [Hyphomicrobium sp.]|jgi:plasmid rolling circle replication initiator protein Rep|uniref:protein rep n=1 Tax=Hyphomicrobium sp. TaxID=82 RepID=UPI0025B941BD|nr:protein rep [Hyphomicrobium sp.]MBX9861163.1 protein rep [Hyphomicrobium sp.]